MEQALPRAFEVVGQRQRPQARGSRLHSPDSGQGLQGPNLSLLGGHARSQPTTFPRQICFDSKPRIISKGTKDSPAVCSNLAAKHSFYNNK